MRESTRERGGLQVSGESTGTGRIPRHILVPFLAGLLIAIVVAVFLRLSASDHRAASAGNGAENYIRVSTESARENPVAKKNPEDDPALRLGPGVKRVVPIQIRMAGLDEKKSANADKAFEVEALADANSATCFFPVADDLGGKVEFLFDGRMRFSHVVVHVGCLRGGSSSLKAEGTIVTEDGSRRHVAVPAKKGSVSVDLAGAWSATITLDFHNGGFDGIGIGDLEFFAFENGGAD